MTVHQRSDSGFRVFLGSPYPEPKSPYVVESSLAFHGPYVWIAVNRRLAMPGDPNGPLGDHIELSLSEAKGVRDALNEFIIAAEAGELTEKP